ncbi:hypothetical protein INT08_06320 [Prosthecochloris sp. N3]|uniref:DUF4834 domain-containing protein n=1 Tax=Prosthecochloris ethylica TaxID=2743976 RepID=A0ABR9XSJ2_9CHLB|nr:MULTISPECIES: hypothetical protein [Prosthecochloris]MBF0586862.1 hypothetical protein [Prosthecochloris ethylica]MBF0636790.1 hypothetical protein [Prosthecochloris ethylica]MEC9487168.1 hypothetical protein [Prosthecochloris sp.]NUK48006.1 hypothetical protein [Prosthecochloris ethylica]
MLKLVLLAIVIYLVIRMVLRFFRQKLMSAAGRYGGDVSSRKQAEETDYEVLDSRVRDDER